MTDEERQLIIKSIEHWELDIVSKLIADEILKKAYVWKSNNERVKMFSYDCHLCNRYLYDLDDYLKCLLCPWYKHSKEKCQDNNQEYSKFFDEPNLFTGKSVVNKLWSIGLQDHSNKHFVSDYKYYSYN